MSANLVEQVAAKTAALPLEKQREILDFAEFLEQKSNRETTEQLIKQRCLPLPAQQEHNARQITEEPIKRPRFKSVRGILNADLSNLEEDLAEIRAEMWKNFPRTHFFDNEETDK